MVKRWTSRMRRGVLVAGGTVLALHLAAGPVWAQKAAKPADEGTVLQWIIALGLMIVTAIAAFLNPKRSHLA